MAVEFVNGYGKPLFQIVRNGLTYDSILLPETNEGGLTETWQEISIQHTVISPSLVNYSQRIIKKILGYRATFTLDYTQYIDKAGQLSIKKIFDYEKDGYEIWLTPREEEFERKYKVYFSGESVNINILQGAEHSPGNYNVQLQYTTVDLVPRFDIKDPDIETYLIDLPLLQLNVCNPI